MRRSSGPAGALPALATAALVGLATRLLAHRAGVTGGTGSDPDLWVFAAVDAAGGAGWPLPPLGPALAALLWAAGLTWHGSWLTLSAISLPAAAALSAALAHHLGSTRGVAFAAGLGLLTLPVLASTAWQAGPDALTALAFLAAAGATQALATSPARPSPAAWTAALLGLSAAVLARELGPAVAVGAALGLALRPGRSWRWRLLAPVLLLLGAGLVPAVLADAAAPWDWRWMGRVLRATPDQPPPQVPDWVLEVEGPARLARRAQWTLSRHPEGWLALALGLTAAVHRRWWSLALVQASALGALVVWSQPRHVAVLLPVAVAAMAGWTARAGPAGRRWALVGALGLAALGLWRWKGSLALAREEAAETEALRALGTELCARVGPGDLAAGEPRAFLFCPLPRHAAQALPAAAGEGAAAEPDLVDAAAWASWHAGEPPPGLPWERVPLQSQRYPLYRLRPDLPGSGHPGSGHPGSGRPCAGSRPLPGTPTFPSPPRPAVMEPPCAASPTALPAGAAPREPSRRLRDLRPARGPASDREPTAAPDVE